ncbi:dihydroxyacetone kinase subunit DhaL [Nocardia sp. NPDC055053]
MTTIDATRWLRVFAALIDEHADELTALDAAIGDADHGSNMRRGTAAVVAALDDDPQPTAGAVLKQAGMVLIRSVGGASGPLYGTFFLRGATATGDGEFDGPTFAAAFRAGLDGVVARGKAELGDKTMVDALVPAADTLDEQLAAGADLAVALDAALAAATTGRDATIPLVARKGRASYLGERSAGHQDPGATSATLLVAAAGQALW